MELEKEEKERRIQELINERQNVYCKCQTTEHYSLDRRVRQLEKFISSNNSLANSNVALHSIPVCSSFNYNTVIDSPPYSGRGGLLTKLSSSSELPVASANTFAMHNNVMSRMEELRRKITSDNPSLSSSENPDIRANNNEIVTKLTTDPEHSSGNFHRGFQHFVRFIN